MDQAEQELSAGDWIGAVVGGLVTFVLFVFPIAIGPTFERMFQDFGGTLPKVTELVLQIWFAPLLGVLPLGLLAFGLAQGPLRRRRLALVLAFLVGATELGLVIWAVYLPVFALAGRIEV
ncbi:MAG: hypothetical protein U1E65_00365 [Myxococcota bacterium]